MFLFGAMVCINAQIKSEFSLGLAMPVGNFSGDDINKFVYEGGKEGGAGTGFQIGYKILSPLSVNGLYWTLGANVIYNDLNGDIKEEFEDDLEDADSYSLPKYLNIPVLAGVQYERSITNNLSVYGEVGIGVNFLKITNLSYEYSENGYEEEFSQSFNLATGFGYKIGAGIVINSKYTVGLSYLGLGSHKVKYEWEKTRNGVSNDGDGKFDKNLGVSSFNLSVGIRF
jgi:opacity protein-like surface antigen